MSPHTVVIGDSTAEGILLILFIAVVGTWIIWPLEPHSAHGGTTAEKWVQVGLRFAGFAAFLGALALVLSLALGPLGMG